jgi:hypothetical protein
LVFSGLLAASAAYAQTPPPAAADPVPEPAKADAAAAAMPPAPVPAPPPPVENKPADSWFKRQPFQFSSNGWKLSVYGNIEFNIFHDSTRSFQEGSGNNLVARDGTYNATEGRTIITSRNSRIGFRMEIPTTDGIKTTAMVEGDFPGNQPGNPPTGITEASFYTAGTFRMRYASVKLESDVVDVLAGQALNLFGQAPFFFPCTANNLGIPNEVFSRTPQLRISKTIKTDALNIDVGIAALRSPQRDSELPDGQGALRFSLNHWKGIQTPAYAFVTANPAAIGVSGVVRKFKVDPLGATAPTVPMSTQSKATGWGVSVDAFLPVIPVKNSDDRANALSITGSFTTGKGISDLYGMNGGISVTNPSIPMVAAMAGPPAVAAVPAMPLLQNIDPGMAVYDTGGVLHVIPWQTFMAGFQYYLPPTGRLSISGNYSQGDSKGTDNIVDVVSGVMGAAGRVYKKSQYMDASIFFDVTASVRVAGSFQRIKQTYGDDVTGTNNRGEFNVYFQF